MVHFSVVLSTFGFLATPLVASFVMQTNGRLTGALHAKSARNSANPEPPGQDPAKLAALSGVLNQIERLYGRGSIVKLGDAESMRVSCIGSGSLTLDAAMGGGYPKGR